MILGLQDGEGIIQKPENDRNSIKLPQTTPRKATNEYGKEKSNNQNEETHKRKTPGHGGS